MLKEPQNYFATLVTNTKVNNALIFEQNLQYKVIELLRLEMNKTEEEEIKDSVSYRYNFVKAKLEVVQSRFMRFVEVVRVKNPSLVTQLEKSLKAEQVLNKKAKS